MNLVTDGVLLKECQVNQEAVRRAACGLQVAGVLPRQCRSSCGGPGAPGFGVGVLQA